MILTMSQQDVQLIVKESYKRISGSIMNKMNNMPTEADWQQIPWVTIFRKGVHTD